MISKNTQLILAAINPLDSIDIACITSVEKIGDKLKINHVDEQGQKQCKDTKATDFIMTQIREYGIEYSEV